LRLLGRPLASRIAVLITSEDETSAIASVSSNLVKHATTPGLNLIVVTNGFRLCDMTMRFIKELCVSCGSLSFLAISEMVGFGVALNLALETSAILERGPKHAIVVALTTTHCLNRASLGVGERGGGDGPDTAGSEGGDVWTAYEALVLSLGAQQGLLVFTAPESRRSALRHQQQEQSRLPQRASDVAPLPLLVFSLDTWRRTLGPLDEGFWSQGAAGEWAYRARSRGILVDATAPPFDFHRRFLQRPETCVVASLGGGGGGGGGGENRRAYDSPESTGPSVGWKKGAVAAEELEEGAQQPHRLAEVRRAASLADLDADHLWAHALAAGCLRDTDPARCHAHAVGAAASFGAAAAAGLGPAASDAPGPGVDSKVDSKGGSASVAAATNELAWHAAWSGRGTSEVVALGWSDEVRVGAVVLLYDDALGLVNAMLPELIGTAQPTQRDGGGCVCVSSSSSFSLSFSRWSGTAGVNVSFKFRDSKLVCFPQFVDEGVLNPDLPLFHLQSRLCQRYTKRSPTIARPFVFGTSSRLWLLGNPPHALLCGPDNGEHTTPNELPNPNNTPEQGHHR
jgi:hypothetical protein